MFDTLGFIEKKTNLSKRYKGEDIPKDIYRQRPQRTRRIKAEVEEECTFVGYFKIFKEKSQIVFEAIIFLLLCPFQRTLSLFYKYYFF